MSDRCHVTLLLVEDDELVRLTVAMTLEDLGFTVLEATTGEAALQQLKTGLDTDILVTDIDLGPGISGLQLADVTGAKPRAKTNRIPIYITKTTKKAAYIQGGRVTDPL